MNGREYIRRIADRIVAAQRPIKILKAINWDESVHRRFFARNATQMPRVVYAPLPYEPEKKIAELEEIRKEISGANPLEDLLRRKCDEFIDVVQMLQARGTKRFNEISIKLYGRADDGFVDEAVDNLAIARLWASRPPSKHEVFDIPSHEAVERIRAIVEAHLGRRCRIKESDRITSNAAAGATTIAIKKGEWFSDSKVRALAHHEGLWHVLTSLNGYRQPNLTCLGIGLPRFTECQEGGAILAEYLTGSITNNRFIELGERTIGIDMAQRGANYLQVYNYLIMRFSPQKAASMCERVFRGGDLEGGAPFTKDATYQRGYCKTFNFFRTILLKDDTDSLRAFLCGKMHVDDVPLVKELMREGIVVGPTFVPAWYRDMDHIDAMFTHSATMNRFDVQKVAAHYETRESAMKAFQTAPMIDPETLPITKPPARAEKKFADVVPITEGKKSDKSDRAEKDKAEKSEKSERGDKSERGTGSEEE
ncbi:MAG TPA: flavohemoglobin expression-modulating QEGLA motif protein [bacterium]|nr:flavohemoglobin expression-modulating QEGLA motif protein [bacterium]